MFLTGFDEESGALGITKGLEDGDLISGAGSCN